MKKLFLILTVTDFIYLQQAVHRNNSWCCGWKRRFLNFGSRSKAADLVGALQTDGPFTVLLQQMMLAKIDSKTLNSLLEAKKQKH
jgi:hypothetical protein